MYFDYDKSILQILESKDNAIQAHNYILVSQHRLNSLFLDYLADEKLNKMNDEEIIGLINKNFIYIKI